MLIFLGVVGGVTAFVCMCLNLQKMNNTIELDHRFAIISLKLVSLIFWISISYICCSCVCGCCLTALDKVAGGVIFDSLGINSEKQKEEISDTKPGGGIIGEKCEEFSESASITGIDERYKGNSHSP